MNRLDPTGTYRILFAMFLLICGVMTGLLYLMAVMHSR